MTKTTLSAGDLMVIHNSLYKSLNVVGNSIWTQETRERVMDKVSIIMEQMKAEVVCGDVEPIVVSGDLGEWKTQIQNVPEKIVGLIMNYKEPKYSKEYIEEWTPLYGKYAEGILKSIHRNKYITDGLMNALDEVRKKND